MEYSGDVDLFELFPRDGISLDPLAPRYSNVLQIVTQNRYCFTTPVILWRHGTTGLVREGSTPTGGNCAIKILWEHLEKNDDAKQRMNTDYKYVTWATKNHDPVAVHFASLPDEAEVFVQAPLPFLGIVI